MLDPSSKVSTGVTIPEGLRANETLATIAADSKFTAKQMEAAFADTPALGLPSYANGDAEGYLYPGDLPDQPRHDPGEPAQGDDHPVQAGGRRRTPRTGAAALHLSPTDVVDRRQPGAGRGAPAAGHAEGRPGHLQPAAAGMPLQLDSTLHYAVDSRGVVQANQGLRNLATPYNTYKHAGLPPTPIDSPGAMALQAALHPAPGSWLYFVTVNLRTGETLFATT